MIVKSSDKTDQQPDLQLQIDELTSTLKRTQVTLAVVIGQRDKAMNELADSQTTIALLTSN